MNVKNFYERRNRKIPRNCNHCANLEIATGRCSFYNYIIGVQRRKYGMQQRHRLPSRTYLNNCCSGWQYNQPRSRSFGDMFKIQRIFLHMQIMNRESLYFFEVRNIIKLTRDGTKYFIKKMRIAGYLKAEPVLSPRRNYVFLYSINKELHKLLLEKVDQMPLRIVK